MAIALVGEVGFADGPASSTVTITVGAAGCASGNTLIGGSLGSASRTVTGVTDSKSNTYVVDQVMTTTGTVDTSCSIFHSNLTTPLVNGDTIVIQHSGTTSGGRWGRIDEWSGLTTSSTDDARGAAEGTVSPLSVTTSATVLADELVIGGFTSRSGAAAYTQGAGYTTLGSGVSTGTIRSLYMEYKIVAATGAQTVNCTATGTPAFWTAVGVTYKAETTTDPTAPAGMFDPQLVQRAWF